MRRDLLRGRAIGVSDVVVDLDGTLLDTRKRHHRACELGCVAAGMRAPARSTFWRRKRAGMATAAAAGVQEPAGVEAFRRAWSEAIESDGLLALDRLQPGALTALARWRRDGARITIATSRQDAGRTLAQLARLGVAELVDDVVCVPPGASKVDAVRRVERGAQGLWVGDTEADAEAARALGYRLALVTSGIRSPRFLTGLDPDLLAGGVYAVAVSSTAARSRPAPSRR